MRIPIQISINIYITYASVSVGNESGAENKKKIMYTMDFAIAVTL